jgi:hypothetical protein
MPKERPRRYTIDIQDDKGNGVIFASANWTDDERRVAVGRVLRLAGLPDTGCFTEKPKAKS